MNNIPALGLLPDLLGYQIRTLQLAVFQSFERFLGELEITPTQFGALVVVDSNPGLKQAQLARAIQLDRSTVVSLVDRLQSRKLIERKRLNADRRSNALVLTKKGKRLLGQALVRVQKHEANLVKDLDKNERNAMKQYLQQIQENALSDNDG